MSYPAKASRLWSSTPPTVSADGADAGGSTGWPATCPWLPTAAQTRMPARVALSAAWERPSQRYEA